MNGEMPDVRPDVVTFPMKKPEMQIGQPVQVKLPYLPVESDYARSTQTWD